MKKIWLGAAIAVLTAALCLCAAGCGEQTIDPEKITSETVTAEQWAAAFETENFASYRIEVYEYYESEESGTISKDGNKGVMKWTQKDSESDPVAYTRYLEKDESGSVLCNVREGSNDWQERSDEKYFYELLENPAVFALLKSIRSEISVEYGVAITPGGTEMAEYQDFAFSEEEKGYVYTEEDPTTQKKVIVKFQNGKIAAVVWEMTENGTMQIRGTLAFSYESQKIERPVLADPAE